MVAQLAACREEDGCLDYSYGFDVLDRGRILILERN